MHRREFITLIGGAAAWPLAAHAQRPTMPIIGMLSIGTPEGATPENDAAFERGLAERGYVIGRNVTIERRWARGSQEKLSELAQELVHLKPALIMGGGNVVALAAKRATSTIPIVFNIASDPVKLGLAVSFAHPGGNATGISIMTATLVIKRLELIRELVPNASVGFLVNPDNQDLLREIEDIARSTGRSLEVAKARNYSDLEPAFAQLVSAQVGAVLVGNDANFFVQRAQLVALAKRHSLPATYEFREFAAMGGLMSYGPSLAAASQKVGIYAGRILEGAKPGDLPIQQPTEFNLVINSATARSLGLQIPPSLLARVDEVIE
jgi:putative ABC transport system substrate-binding protein